MTRIRFHRMVRLITRRTYGSPIHYETGVAPMAGWLDGLPSPVTGHPAQLREAYLWSEHRTVSKAPRVSLHGNTYQADELLVGRKVEQVFDSLDLARSPVVPGRCRGRATAASRTGARSSSTRNSRRGRRPRTYAFWS